MSSNSAESENSSSSASSSRRNNGTFRWTEERDRIFLREVLLLEPFSFKAGTKESGLKWTEVSEKINCYAHFSSNPRDQRSVREHFNKLLADYKKKITKEESASGIAPDLPTENEKMLEEIVEIMKSPPIHVASDGKKQEKKRKDALLCRDKAMKTWSKAEKSGGEDDDSSSEGETEREQPSVHVKRRKRRGGSDALQYLAEKTERETELRKQELELRREELHLQAEQQREQFKMQQEQIKLMAEVFTKLTK